MATILPLITATLTIVVVILEYFSARTSNTKRKNIISVSAVVFVAIIQFAGCKYSMQQDKENKQLAGSVDSIKLVVNKSRDSLSVVSLKLDSAINLITNINNALERSGLRYDSTKGEILKVNNNAERIVQSFNQKGGVTGWEVNVTH